MRLLRPFQMSWLAVTALLLVLTLYLNWYLNLKFSQNTLSLVANELSNDMDDLIEDLFQEAYTLPVYGEDPPHCDNLYPMLERITLNNPIMAGLVLKTPKEYCATLPEDSIPTFTDDKSRTFSGPFLLSVFDQPIYLVHQKMGHFHLGIVLLSSLLQKKLQLPLDAASSIVLADTKRNLMRLEHNQDENQWVLSSSPNAPMPHASLQAKESLQSINNLFIVISANPQTLKTRLWTHALLSSIGVLILSYGFYLLFSLLLRERYSLRGALKLAVKQRTFFPVYQALYDTKKKCFAGVEVLLRWQEASGQINMPDLFIQEAEQTGLIISITLQLIETTFKEFQTILNERPYFHIGFNLCAQHFSHQSFFDEFEKLITTYQIAKTQLLLEITERDLIDANNPLVINKMNALREAGFSLAVDDYGTGHASISYLRHFPLNYLKIDKLFVQAIGSHAVTESLNDSIIQMSHDLSLQIIAEGVETEQQANYLSAKGVRLLQGYYFSKPLSLNHLIPLLGEPACYSSKS